MSDRDLSNERPDKSSRDWYAYMHSRLGIEPDPEEQDFGLSNSDGKRVKEFIDFYYEHPDLDPYYQPMLGELIFASFQEALELGLAQSDIEQQMAEFVLDVSTRLEQWDNFSHWLGYKDGGSVDPNVLGRWLYCVLGLDASTGADWFASTPDTPDAPLLTNAGAAKIWLKHGNTPVVKYERRMKAMNTVGHVPHGIWLDAQLTFEVLSSQLPLTPPTTR